VCFEWLLCPLLQLLIGVGGAAIAIPPITIKLHNFWLSAMGLLGCDRLLPGTDAECVSKTLWMG
jgi:hypothetical protein